MKHYISQNLTAHKGLTKIGIKKLVCAFKQGASFLNIIIPIAFLVLGACTRDPKPDVDPPKEEPNTTQAINEVKPKLEQAINQQLEKAFKGPAPIDQKVTKAKAINEGVESQARLALNQEAKIKDIIPLEERVEPVIAKIETGAINQTLQLMEKTFNQAQEELNNSLTAFNKAVESSYPLMPVEKLPLAPKVQPISAENSDENINKEVKTALSESYNPHELALLQKPKPLALEDLPYKFKTSEGEFLTKIQDLYLKIYNTHPYHEQGRIARALALSTLEVADEIKEKSRKQHLAYEISQTLMLNIDSSLFEESKLSDKESRQKWGQNIYEVVFGKHFLTGRTLTEEERAVRILDSSYLNKKLNWNIMAPALEGLDKEEVTVEDLEKALKTLHLVLTLIHSHAKETHSFIEEGDLKVIGDKAHNMLL